MSSSCSMPYVLVSASLARSYPEEPSSLVPAEGLSPKSGLLVSPCTLRHTDPRTGSTPVPNPALAYF